MGDFDPHQCFKQPLVVSEALEWEIRPTPLMTEVLNDEVNLIDVVDLVVDNEMVSVLKVRWLYAYAFCTRQCNRREPT